MGVRGLFSFFENNHDNFFMERNLDSSYLVIDGNNLRYHLYNTCPKKNCYFGGDYDKYYDHVLSFFQQLIACNIKPIVIIDGSFEDAKRKTLWQRSRDQIKAGIHCAPYNSLIVLPLMAKEVFLRAARDLKHVTLIQDFFEADSNIAMLSSVLKCPVLSNDSDFFVFDVEVISLRNLEFHYIEEGTKCCLKGKAFDREAFLTHFGIVNKDLLFLLASLMGNDYVPGNVFERVFSQIRLPKKKSQCPRHRKMTGLLYWLSRENDMEGAIDRLLNAIPLKDRETLRSKLNTSIEMYKLDSQDKVFSNKLQSKTAVPDAIDSIFSGSSLEHRISSIFLAEYRRSVLPNWLLDVILHNQIFLPSQVEDKEQQSSHDFAQVLLKSICEVVLSFNKEGKEKEQETNIKVVAREGNKCVAKVINCSPDRILNLKQLGELDTQRREKHLFTMLQLTDDQAKVMHDQCDKKLQLIFLAINFWCLQPQFPNMVLPNQTEFGAVIAMISIHICKENNMIGAKSNVNCLYKMNQDLKSKRKLFDIRVVQSFANLQTTLMYTLILNRLLEYPLQEPDVHTFWNSTFLYNTSHVCDNISDIQSKLDFKEFRDYLQFCDKFIPCYKNLKPKVIIKRSFKPKKNRRASERAISTEFESLNDKSFENSHGLDYNDLQNKFSLLSMA